ncbi:MAG: undecaprenyldiphospho-muramoylpentapeptide beta-N-acetylglucosaminyltransferase [Ruminococcaceae bacterium]|nr:undecaprenyldiphospho-muramoylpentapeptide beta-N-acetylglucosaminyltransferase [Oscillospiraceae bacterium]
MKVIFACGGTAGHINPALSVAAALSVMDPYCDFLFIGAEGRMETDLVPRAGFPIKTIDITNIHRSIRPMEIAHNVNTLIKVVKSKGQAKKIIREFDADVVIGTGGYVCYPVLKAAAELGIPTAMHESNAIPGLTTRMLQNVVDIIMVGFDECKSEYKNPEKVMVTGTPIRPEFFDNDRDSAKRLLGLDPNKPLVVSIWGSLGAANMNLIIKNMMTRASADPFFTIIHASGKVGYKKMLESLKRDVPNHDEIGLHVKDYIYDIPLVLAAADLAICRAGSSTLAELAALGKPAILVPSPNVTRNHQEPNARVLEKSGGAKVILENEITADLLLGLVSELLHKPEKLEEMASKMSAVGVADSANIIADAVVKLVKNKEK